MIHIEELKKLISDDLFSLDVSRPSEDVDLLDAVDRVLAKDMSSPIHIPTSSVSAMDGYALCVDTEDLKPQNTLSCIGESIAGKAFKGSIGEGECVRIMTGAIIPDGANTVIMQEHVKASGSEVVLTHSIAPSVNIRYRGEEVEKGDVVMTAGSIICESDIALLASLGNKSISVLKKLTIGIFSTGDELCELGTQLEDGQLYDSNRSTIKALLRTHPVEITDYGIIRDNLEVIKTTLSRVAKENDIIVTSGGVSVGDYDFLKDAVSELGDIVHYKVAMKPGKPFVYGRIGTARYFGLPGNPLSATISAKMFLVPAIYQMLTDNAPTDLVVKGTLKNAVKRKSGRAELQRGYADCDKNGNWTVDTSFSQDSHRVYRFSLANVLVFIPAEETTLSEGDTVTLLPLTGKFL